MNNRRYPLFVQLLQQLLHLIGYVGLQLVLSTLVPFLQGCFVYIGFFLLLPWRKSQMVFQLIMAFCVGLCIDTVYNSVGVHAFAAVLIVYCRYFLLYILSPHATNNDPYPLGPTLQNMGLKQFSVYGFLLILLYHATVFSLGNDSYVLFSSKPSMLIGRTLLSYGCILAPMVLALPRKHP